MIHTFHFHLDDGKASMHGIPQDFDASVFIGSILEPLTFTQNSIHFVFDPGRAITLSSSYVYRFDRTVNGIEKGVVPVTSSRLMELVGQVVKSAESDKRLLRLGFDEGRSLEFLDDSDQYESFTIAIGNREIFV